MPVFGISDTARNYTRLGDKWGTIGGNAIRGLLNFCIPVSVIERFRDENEGGVYGLTAITPGFGTVLPPNPQTAEFPACCFTNLTTAFRIHRMNIVFNRGAPVFGAGGPGSNYQELINVYSPFGDYNPCANNVLGLFRPGLIARNPFVFGGTVGVSGTNPLLPVQPEGWIAIDTDVRFNGNISRWRGDVQGGNYITGGVLRYSQDDLKAQNTMHFDPPIRVPPDGVIAVQRQNFPNAATDLFQPFDLAVSILYTEEPDRR